MPQHCRAGVVQHHAGGMQHPAHHVDGVLGAFKPFLQLLCFPACILDLDILPAVDVDLLDAGSEHILGQEGELRHLRIDGVHQLLAAHALHGDPVILHIFGDVPLDLLPCILPALFHDQRGILTGDILLYLLQDGRKIPGVILRGEEQVMGPECRPSLLEPNRLILLFHIPDSRRLHRSCMDLGIGHAHSRCGDPGSGKKVMGSGVFFLCRSPGHIHFMRVRILSPDSSGHDPARFSFLIYIAAGILRTPYAPAVPLLCHACLLSVPDGCLPHPGSKQLLGSLFS